jgi:hypothetical protein
LGSVRKRIVLLTSSGIKARPYLKNNHSKKDLGHEGVEHLLSKHEALNSNPSLK